MATSILPARAQHSGEEAYQHDYSGPRQFESGSELTMQRYLQALDDAEVPEEAIKQQYHTGKLPNSKVQDGKPRLLLMGQKRYGSTRFLYFKTRSLFFRKDFL